MLETNAIKFRSSRKELLRPIYILKKMAKVFDIYGHLFNLFLHFNQGAFDNKRTNCNSQT